MPRQLAAVITDQELAFAELLESQRRLETLNRSGGQMSIVDGEATSEVDTEFQRVHNAQHQLEALAAEALQAALAPAPD